MGLLKRHFPYSLTSSVLLANLCWEFAMSWDKDVTQLDSLAAALTVLRQIPMKNMRHGKCAFTLFFQTTPTILKCKSFRFTCIRVHLYVYSTGVCCLLWTLHIKKRMEAAAKLMNKLGKLPKERLCLQEIGLSDIQVTTFLQHCVTFLDIFIDVRRIQKIM